MSQSTRDAPISTMRLLIRIANALALDVLSLYRGERDFTDALILSALTQSEAAGLGRDPDQHRRYAAFETPVPAMLRRPLSVNAIAGSLGLPFETVRRRTKRLIADGVCEATPQGVQLTDAALSSPAHRLALDAAYGEVHDLYLRLVRADCLSLMELPPYAEPFDATAPVRIVWRAASEYFLRIMEMMLPTNPSVTQVFVIMEVVRTNTRDFSDTLRGDDATHPEAFVSDSHRTPMRASELAARLGLPYETARRNLMLLVEDGRVQRVDDGFIVPAATLARSAAVFRCNFQNLSRMFVDLAQTGVLARWDAEARRAVG
jgi:hypothetical protein